jgi:hypothetical protein
MDLLLRSEPPYRLRQWSNRRVVTRALAMHSCPATRNSCCSAPGRPLPSDRMMPARNKSGVLLCLSVRSLLIAGRLGTPLTQ